MTRQDLLDALTAERFTPTPPRPPRALVPITPAAGQRNLDRLAAAIRPRPKAGRDA